MPAANMAGPVVVPANPAGGKAVIMDPYSGPKGSPLDAKTFNPTTLVKQADPTNYSTGALSTGIGHGLSTGPVINVSTGSVPFTAPGAIDNAGFTDDVIPGVTMPNGTSLNGIATLLYIGGGRSIITPGPGNDGLGVSTNSPLPASPVLAFGAGASRDAGAGPAFTGFGMKMVTAAGAVADGAAIEAGWTNRTGKAMVATDSAYGSSTTASPALPVLITLLEEEEEEEEEEP